MTHKISESSLGVLLAVLFLAAADPAEAADGDPSQAIADLQLAVNFAWVAAAAAMVFLMQAGFMCLESGMARAKNSINIVVKNIADFVLAVSFFWVVGYGLMFGESWAGFVGTSDFLISTADPWQAMFFVF